ncbi:hypothetical protein ACG7TL_008384 [Trametes sanguinea]
MFVHFLFAAIVAGEVLLATTLGDLAPGSALSAADASDGSDSVPPCLAGCLSESVHHGNVTCPQPDFHSQLQCVCQNEPLLSAVALCVLGNCADETQNMKMLLEQDCGASVTTAFQLPGTTTTAGASLSSDASTDSTASMGTASSGTVSGTPTAHSSHAASTSDSASGTSARPEPAASSSSTTRSQTTTLTVQPLAATISSTSLPPASTTDTSISSAAENSTSLPALAPSGTISSQSSPAKTSNAAVGDVIVGGLPSVVFTCLGASMVALVAVY